MYCPACGTANDDKNIFCERCGTVLETPRPAAAPLPTVEPPVGQYPHPAQPRHQPDNTMGGLIPYKNQSALLAYYLAVFSLIPCFGLFLGIAAFILGLKGLRYAKEQPEAKGATHAWVGIILGGFCGFGSILLILWFVGAATFQR